MAEKGGDGRRRYTYPVLSWRERKAVTLFIRFFLRLHEQITSHQGEKREERRPSTVEATAKE